MNAIMMYMSGNSLQIFSIMMVFMLFKGPIQGLINTNTVFAKFDTEGTRAKLLGVKAIYVVMQLVLLCLGVWKVNAMGLLPYVLSAFLPYEGLCFWTMDSTGRLCLANIGLRQDYEIGLAGLGVGTATVGAGLLRFWLIGFISCPMWCQSREGAKKQAIATIYEAPIPIVHEIAWFNTRLVLTSCLGIVQENRSAVHHSSVIIHVQSWWPVYGHK